MIQYPGITWESSQKNFDFAPLNSICGASVIKAALRDPRFYGDKNAVARTVLYLDAAYGVISNLLYSPVSRIFIRDSGVQLTYAEQNFKSGKWEAGYCPVYLPPQCLSAVFPFPGQAAERIELMDVYELLSEHKSLHGNMKHLEYNQRLVMLQQGKLFLQESDALNPQRKYSNSCPLNKFELRATPPSGDKNYTGHGMEARDLLLQIAAGQLDQMLPTKTPNWRYVSAKTAVTAAAYDLRQFTV